VIALLFVLAFAAPAERPMIDAELSSQCGMSSVAIYASGFAHFHASNTCGTAEEFVSGLRPLSPADLRAVEGAIAAARFDSLPVSIAPDPKVVVTEEDVFSIRVWRAGSARRVDAFGLERALDKSAAQRFEALWRAVVKYGSEGAK
jgi:hypothetical protein